MNYGARKGVRARCRTGSLPEHAHIHPVRAGRIIAQPTHRDYRPVVPSARLGIHVPALLSWCHFPVNIGRSDMVVSTGSAHRAFERTKRYMLPRATLFLRLCNNSQVCDVRYGGQGLSAETVSCEMVEVIELG
jgi:hypothetical protein